MTQELRDALINTWSWSLNHPDISVPLGLIICGFVFIKYILPLHNWRRRRSKKALRDINAMLPDLGPAHVFEYMRRLDPFVFEEMILDALKARGYKVIRNRRYWGDGGIDGRVMIADQKLFIQAKRYRRVIEAAHVRAFADICKKSKSRGLFIHTGRTGPRSRSINRSEPSIEIISGEKILSFFSGEPVKVFDLELKTFPKAEKILPKKSLWLSKTCLL
ncbi:MAG: restriction endonuclease [Pseudomonadota bacterium]